MPLKKPWLPPDNPLVTQGYLRATSELPQGCLTATSGLPQGYLRATSGLLQGYLSAISVVPQGYRRATSGLPQGHLRIDWLTHWLIDWLIDSLTHWLINWWNNWYWSRSYRPLVLFYVGFLFLSSMYTYFEKVSYLFWPWLHIEGWDHVFTMLCTLIKLSQQFLAPRGALAIRDVSKMIDVRVNFKNTIQVNKLKGFEMKLFKVKSGQNNKWSK